MSDSDINQISNSRYKLFEIGPADFRSKPSLFGQKLKEFSSFSKLQNDKWSYLFRLVSNLNLGLFSAINDVDKMLVVEFA